MAAITATSLLAAGAVAVTETTLGASDTFEYATGAILVLRNASAGALTPKIDGDGGSTVKVGGLPPVDVSAGYTLASVAAGAVVAVRLDGIAEYLKGTITVSGGDAMVATLLQA